MSFLDNLRATFNVRPTAPTPSRPSVAPSGPSDVPSVVGRPPAAWEAYEALLRLREGCRNVVYEDSLGKPTVGIGHLVRPEDGLVVGMKVSDAQVSAFFAHDGAGAMTAAVQQAKQANITSQEFLPYLASVCFQLGNAWTAKFPNTWAMIVRGQYGMAAAALHGTAWNSQTPVRVKDFQDALNRLPAKS